MMGFPTSFSSFYWSPLPLCDLIRKWTAFFRWLTLPNIPCRKKDACQRTGLGSARGMSCYKRPLADLLIWPQRAKAAFWCLGVLASPGKCPKKGRRAHPQLRLLPAGADWRLSQAVPGGDRGLGVCLAMRRVFCTFKYLNFQVGRKVFEERYLEVAGGRAS